MKRSKILLILAMGLVLVFISGNSFAVKTPIVFPEENAIFYPGESNEETVSAQGWASITKGDDNGVEVAITASGLFKDCRHNVRFTDPSTGKKEDLGAFLTDQEGKGFFSIDVTPGYLSDWKLIGVYGSASCAGPGGREERILSFNLEETGERG